MRERPLGDPQTGPSGSALWLTRERERRHTAALVQPGRRATPAATRVLRGKASRPRRAAARAQHGMLEQPLEAKESEVIDELAEFRSAHLLDDAHATFLQGSTAVGADGSK